MASPEARAVVAVLQAGGLTLSDIGRALERDSGMLSQIARGARGQGYGASLVPALEALRDRVSSAPGQLLPPEAVQAGARIVADTRSIEAPRRRTKRGQLAAVRAGVKRAGPKDAALPGLYTKGTAGGNRGALATILSTAADTGQLVYINVTDSTGKRVGLGARTADEWEALGLDFEGGDFEWDDVLSALADNGELGSDVETVTGWTASMVAA